MSSPQADAKAAAVVAVYQQQTQAIRAQLTAFITALWGSLGSYREPQMAAFIKQVTPVVLGAQQHMSAMTAAYLATQRQLAIGGAATPAAVNTAVVTGAAARNGTDPAEVYARPFHLVWRQLAAAQAERDAHYNWTTRTGDQLTRPPLPPADYVEQAIQQGMDRAVDLAQTDVQLAKVQTAQQVVSKDPVATGYRRVLEGSYSCGLCIVAATLRYRKKDLLPIHGGCDCGIEPIYTPDELTVTPMVRTADGGLAPVGELPDVHDRIAATFGKNSSAARSIGVEGSKGKPILYRDAIITHDHGELGAVLAVRGQDFTGPRDIAKHKSPKPAA